MCVIFFYACSNPLPGGYKLILASNRDEFFARDTRDAGKWANAPHVYGGIDLEPGREGGTWLAIGGDKGVFKIGALLNLTGEPKPRNAQEQTHNNNNPTHNSHLLGRGMIVSDFVRSSLPECNSEQYNKKLLAECDKYSAFNFVSIEIGQRDCPAQIKLLSNVPASLEHYVDGKCYGFGNSLPAVPFVKVHTGEARFQKIVDEFNQHLQSIETAEQAQNALIQNLMNMLKCKEKFWPDAELKRRAPNWGEYLSSLNVNVQGESYGSRTHTVILVDGNNKMHFVEETMAELDPAGEWRKTQLDKQFFEN